MPLAPPPMIPILKHPLWRRGVGDDDSDSGGVWSEFKFEFAFKCEFRLLAVVKAGNDDGKLSDDA